MFGKGTAKVVVEATLPADGKGSPLEGTFAIQVGAFAEKENAERFQRDLKRKYSQVHMVLWESNQRRIHRVRLGAFRSEVEARSYLEILKRDNISGMVVRED